MAKLTRPYGQLQFDEDTGTIYVEETDNSETSPENRHGEESPTVGAIEPESQSAAEASAETDDIDSRAFGEMVHRLCELRPPETQWPNLMPSEA